MSRRSPLARFKRPDGSYDDARLTEVDPEGLQLLLALAAWDVAHPEPAEGPLLKMKVPENGWGEWGGWATSGGDCEGLASSLWTLKEHGS